MLNVANMREAFAKANMSQVDIEAIFQETDLQHEGVIHYSDFLSVVMDRRYALAQKNLKLAFHHF